MAFKRPDRRTKGKCGDERFTPDMMQPMTEAEKVAANHEYSYKLNPTKTNMYMKMAYDAIFDAQSRLCVLENAQEPEKVSIGALSYTPEVNTYGTFTIKDLEIENYSEIAKLHVFLVHVNEVKPCKATVAGAVSDGPDDVIVTVSQSGTDASDPELTFSEGDWVLWNDKSPGGTDRGGHKFEISRIKTITSPTNWTLQRNPSNDSRLNRSYFGSYIDSHAAGIDLYKVQVKHIPWRIKQGPWFGDFETDYERRFDTVWPSRCVLATQIIAELNSKDYSDIYEVSLVPTVDTTTDGDATTTPVSPGLRTLAGQSYILPALTGEDDVAIAQDTGKRIRSQDLASIRCIYFDCVTAPQGGPITAVMKYRPIGGAWTDIESIDIPIGQTNSFSDSTTNNPANRRMPYTLDWPPPVVPQDAEISFDVDAIGTSGVAGAGLVGYLQT